MLNQIEVSPTGFRRLNSHEVMAVSGGTENNIVVIGNSGDAWTISVTAEDLALIGSFGAGAGPVLPGTTDVFGGDDGGGGGGIPITNIPNADEAGCPNGQTCTPVEGTNDMFVRGEDGKLYLSPQGIERAQNGADTNWWGVAIDLVIIVGGSLGGVGAGVVGVLGGLLGITGAQLKELLEFED
ncbi:MAG: hypothetical protein AAF650_05250 [Pseudomonadota bacterium]